MGCGGGIVLDLYFDFIYKIKITMRRFAPFCSFKIVLHETSVRSNIIFYDLCSFIVLEPIPPFLFKASDLDIWYFWYFSATDSTCLL